jgi:sigma-E factor negative regulatory protein RseA
MKSEVSALMDGELDDKAADAILARMKHEEELVANWRMFQAVSDALRQSYQPGPVLSTDFSERFRQRLAKEPTVVAPEKRRSSKRTTYALSAAASLATVGLILWVALFGETAGPLGQRGENIAGQHMMVQQNSTLRQDPAIQWLREPAPHRVNELLIAHQEFSPSTAMQGVAPYARSVALGQRDTDR